MSMWCDGKVRVVWLAVIWLFFGEFLFFLLGFLLHSISFHHRHDDQHHHNNILPKKYRLNRSIICITGQVGIQNSRICLMATLTQNGMKRNTFTVTPLLSVEKKVLHIKLILLGWKKAFSLLAITRPLYQGSLLFAIELYACSSLQPAITAMAMFWRGSEKSA